MEDFESAFAWSARTFFVENRQEQLELGRLLPDRDDSFVASSLQRLILLQVLHRSGIAR